MNERISTRDLAELLTGQIGLDKKRAEGFLNALSSYILQSIERNKVVRIIGLGTFKVVLVRERESVHIQTGERFVIPAHHKLSFVPDRELKEQINRPFAFFEPIDTSEIHVPKKVTIRRDNDISAGKIVNKQDEIINPDSEVTEVSSIEKIDTIIKDYFDFEENDEISEETYNFEEGVDYDSLKEIPKSSGDSEKDDYDESVYRKLQEISQDSVIPEENEDYLEKDELSVEEDVEETDNDENDYVQTVAIGADEEFEELEFSDEEIDVDHKTEENADLIIAGENKEHIADENNDSIEDVNDDTGQVDSKTITEKRVFAPFWLWVILGSLLIVLGLGTGTFAFLYYNSDNSKKPDQAFVDSKENSLTEADTPSPLGGFLMPDSDLINNSELADFSTENVVPDSIVTEKEAAVPETKDVIKKEEKKVTDWLAILPERSKTETKRADKPNQKIESKNKELAKNANTKTTTANTRNTGTTTTKTTPADSKENVTTKEKIVPGQIPMPAGSSLTQIAMEYYGDKTFWVYIYEHNKSKIKDFNNVPAGTVLKLPLPSTYGINAKSKTSVDKAKQKQAQLLNWDVYN